MKVDIVPGRYVLAVSGGVDSMVLLDLLSRKPGIELIAAHFNHGIRADSEEDEKLVSAAAKKHNLIYEACRGKLGLAVSEAKAREARYGFLNSIKNKHEALSIITAHHQDDLIETVFINLLRGTGRRGLSSISNNANVTRPLLNVPKKQILMYAKSRNIAWREDSTNASDTYLRNYIRSRITGKLTTEDKELMLKNIDKVAEINKILNNEIATLSHNLITDSGLNRHKFIMLPFEVADDLLMHWFRSQGFSTYDRKTVTRARLSIKTALPRTSQPLSKDLKLVVGQASVSLVTTD